MIHHDSWCLQMPTKQAKNLALFSHSAPQANGLPSAGRPFWAAETGRMRLLRQSSSGRGRELPTTQIVTIKPQNENSMEIPLKNPMFFVVVFLNICPFYKRSERVVWGFGTTVVRQSILGVGHMTWPNSKVSEFMTSHYSLFQINRTNCHGMYKHTSSIIFTHLHVIHATFETCRHLHIKHVIGYLHWRCSKLTVPCFKQQTHGSIWLHIGWSASYIATSTIFPTNVACRSCLRTTHLQWRMSWYVRLLGIVAMQNIYTKWRPNKPKKLPIVQVGFQ